MCTYSGESVTKADAKKILSVINERWIIRMEVNANDKQINNMLTFLAKCGVSTQDCALAERYLNHEVGEEALEQFQQINFAAMTIPYSEREAFDSIMKELNRSEKRATCIQFFNVLFAIGHGSCSTLLSRSIIKDAKECALYKRIVLFIELGIEYTGYLRVYELQTLMEMAQNNPEILRETLEPLKEEGTKYYLIMLAVYFCMKYGKVRPLDAEDIELMKAYEDEMLDWLKEYLAQQGCVTQEEIVTAIRTQKLTSQLLDEVRQVRQSRLFVEPARKQLCFLGSMAYLNFMLSNVLLDVLRTCMAMDAEWVLCTISEVSIGTLDASRRIKSKGGDYDTLFWIEPETYIRWAAVKEYTHILERQLEKNQESYLKAMEENKFPSLLAKTNRSFTSAPYVTNQMKDVIQKKNPNLYKQVARNFNYDVVIDYLVKDTPHAELAKAYLRGESNITELYPYVEELSGQYVSHNYMEQQRKHCGDKGFFNRCKAFMVLTCSENTTVVDDCWSTDSLEEIERFYQMLCDENLDIAYQFKGVVACYSVYDNAIGCSLSTFEEGTVEAFARYLNGERREETLAAFSGAKAEGRYLGLLVMKRDPARNQQEILNYATDSSKLVREELLTILYAQKDWENEIKALLQGKKATQREIAIQVLSHWQQEGSDYNEVLRQAMGKEKNAKVLTLLQSVLNIQEREKPEETLSKEDLVKQLHKGGKKKSLAWAYEKPFSPVYKTDGSEASEEYLQAVLLCYVSQEKSGVNKTAQLLADDLQPIQFAVYVNELFDRWLAAGAESKKRWVLYTAAIHGGEDIIQKLQHQIQEWPQAARGAIAAEAVKALALNPSPRALLLVDGIARKFKFKQVRAAAGEALAFAASELGITREELSDRIVPDFGFDENMERTFDYGERIFKVQITQTLDFEIYDENGKKLKNLPVPGKKDDKTKATAAYEDFKQLKKQMKTAVTSQKSRLEYALSVRREWRTEAWKNLFVKNPLMHQFAIGLIWGIYDGDKLIQSFRYMEDGSFNTQDEEEYILPEDANISLIHPMELTDTEKAAWIEQLADYEITQPIEQLDRPIYYMTVEEADKKGLERFGGYLINDLSLNGKMSGLGWYRGSVQDAGCFYTYYREDPEAGIGVELHFSGACVGYSEGNVTIYDVRFYKAGTIEHGSYTYDEADANKAYFLKDIPPRYFSEIVLQLARLTASCGERNEDWRKDARLI